MLKGNWKHYFWCINPNKIPKTIKILKNHKNIKIRTIGEIFKDMRAQHLFKALLKNKQYSFCSDIARHNILYLFGGVYADLPTQFLEDLTPLVNAYDVLLLNRNVCCDFSFCAYEKGNKAINQYLNFVDKLYKAPPELKSMGENDVEALLFIVPHPILAFLNIMSDDDARFLLVPDKDQDTLVRLVHCGSWIKFNGLFKSTSIWQSNLDVFGTSPKAIKYVDKNWLDFAALLEIADNTIENFNIGRALLDPIQTARTANMDYTDYMQILQKALSNEIENAFKAITFAK